MGKKDLVGLKVTGAKALRKDIKNAQRDDLKKELKKSHKDAADHVAKKAAANAPKVSGVLSKSIRGLGSLTKAQVAAGGARKAPYAGVVHYGTPKGSALGKRKEQRFMTKAVKSEYRKVIRSMEKNFSRISKTLSSK